MKQIKTLARELDHAAMVAVPVAQISGTNPMTLSEAYALQEEVVSHRLLRGEKLVGLKLGFTSKAKMQQMGVNELIWGRLTDTMEIKDRGTLALRKYIHPRAEPEIAFMIKNDIGGPITLENAREHIIGIAPAIEIIDSRYKNFKFSLEDVIADNCSSSAFVLGEWKSPYTAISNLNMELYINNELEESGNSNAIMGNPMESLVHAVRLAQKHNFELRKGMVVLAGAATSALFLKPGDHVMARVDSLGQVSFSVGKMDIGA